MASTSTEKKALGRIQRTLDHIKPAEEGSAAIEPAQTAVQVAATPSVAPTTQGYRYTVDGHGCLTEEQRRFYEKNGFLVIPRLYSEEELAVYRQRFLDICDKKVEAPIGMTVMRDIKLAKSGGPASGEKSITKIQDFQDEPVLFEYCKNPKMLEYAKSMIGANVRSVHTMLINKPPDLGALTSRHPPHQDLYYFPFRPADRICASWTAMEKIDTQNGCLYVIPGSHKAGELYAHGYPDWEGGVNKAYHGIHNVPKGTEFVNLEMEAGDTVFFHPLLIHGSGANLTDRYRKAISVHMASADSYFIDVRGTVQEDIAKEIEGMFKHRSKKIFGEEMSMDFNDVWRAKSRLVVGEDSW